MYRANTNGKGRSVNAQMKQCQIKHNRSLRIVQKQYLLSSYSLNKSRTCKKTQCSSQDRANTNEKGRNVNAQMK